MNQSSLPVFLHIEEKACVVYERVVPASGILHFQEVFLIGEKECGGLLINDVHYYVS
jgi:hypothetical protein